MFRNKNNAPRFRKWLLMFCFKKNASSILLDKFCAYPTPLRPRPPPLSAFPPFVQYALLCHLFKLSKTDADGFTVQVHYDPVHLSLLQTSGSGCVGKELWANCSFWWAGNANALPISNLDLACLEGIGKMAIHLVQNLHFSRDHGWAHELKVVAVLIGKCDFIARCPQSILAFHVPRLHIK